MKKLFTALLMLTISGMSVLAFFKFAPTLPTPEGDGNPTLEAPSDTNYTINTDSLGIGHVLAHGASPDFSGLTIQKTEGGVTTEIPIDESMIHVNTSNTGEQEVVIRYGEEEFRFNITVKYRIEFRAGDEVLGVQYALTPSEIAPPAVDAPKDMRFLGWSEEIPETLSGNMVFEARFEYDTPRLATLTAEYGDTLADLSLPESYLGTWRFTDAPDTEVGEVGGSYKYAVEFLSEEGEVLANDVVFVKVKKRLLTFDIQKTSFDYNGGRQLPTYTLPYDVNVLFLEDTDYNYTDVGTYPYEFIISDEHYEGSYAGTYTIEPAKVHVTPKTYSISAVDELPKFDFTLTGFDTELVELLKIEITHPTVNGIGEYELSAISKNPNIILTVTKGRLTVRPAYPEIDRVGAPVLSSYVATYEDLLSSLTFDQNANGRWAWKYASDEVGPTGQRTHIAVFTHNDPRYETVELPIEIQVVKKTLIFEVEEGSLSVVFDKDFHRVSYTVKDQSGKIYQDLKVVGDEAFDIVGDYRITLTLDEENYTARFSDLLHITPATPETAFGALAATKWNPTLRLSDITLPKGYTWETPREDITSIGSQTFRAIFTPEDTHNYVSVTGEFTIEILRADTSVLGALDTYTTEYEKGTAFTLPKIQASHGEEVTIDILYPEVPIEDRGEYFIYISISESTHYAAATKTVKVTVTPRINRDLIPTYNQEYLDRVCDFELPKTSTGSWEFLEKDAVLTELGTRVLTLVFTPDNDNYAPATVSVTVTVDRRTVPKPYISDKSYNGEMQYSGLPEDDPEYMITTDEGGDVYGTYEVVLTLRNPSLFRWEGDETSSTATVSFKILGVANGWIDNLPPEADRTTWTYDGDDTSFTAKVTYGGDENHNLAPYFLNEDRSYYGTSCPTNAGTYYAVFEVVETESYGPVYYEIKLFIDAIPVPPPKRPALTTPYTGSPIDSGITPTDGYAVLDSGSTSPKSCQVTITLNENYKWSDGTEARTLVYDYEIVRADAGLTLTSAPSWTYRDAPIDPDWKADFPLSDVDFYYATTIDGTYTKGAPEYANDYYVKAVFAGDTNLLPGESDPMRFTVHRAIPTISGYLTTISGEYYENLFIAPEVTDCTALYKDRTIEGVFSYSRLTFVDGAGNSHITLTFTPEDLTNYQTVTDTVYLTLKTVAKIGETLYGSIESALDAANAAGGGTILVLPDATRGLYIMSSKTIEAGVTLILTYGVYSTTLAEAYNQTNSDGYFEATTSGKHLEATEAKCKLFVTLADGVQLINKGTLTIAGILTGGSAGSSTARYDTGSTAGNHARLLLGAGSAIISESGSTINCLGFINEVEEDNGSSVTIQSGATLLQPFVIHDFRGGSYMYAVNSSKSKEYYPFSEYSVRNVTSTLRINEGGSLYAVANIYSGKQHNATNIYMIGGKNTSAFIQLRDGSYLISKYADGRIHLDIYGGAVTGTMRLTVQLSTELLGQTINIPLNVTTADFYFPIPYIYNITLKAKEGQTNASYEMLQKYLLRGGASITVDPGVTLTVADLAIQDESTLQDITYGGSPYPNDDTGILTINGTLIAQKIGGKIRTDLENGAIVIIRNAATVSTNNAYGSAISGSGMSASLSQVEAVTHTAQIVTADGTVLPARVAPYRLIEGEWRCIWINFNTLEGGSTHASVSTELLTYPTLPTPTRTGYVFLGWLYGDAPVKEGDALLYIGEHTLTASWRKLLWVSYDPDNGDATTTVYIDTTKGVATYSLPTVSRVGFELIGWYLGDTLIENGSAITLTEDHKLIAKWNELLTVRLDENGDGIIEEAITLDLENPVYPTLPTPTLVGHTFLGWFYGEVEVKTGEPLQVAATHTLTAKWEVMSYTVSDITTSNATVTGIAKGDSIRYGDTVTITVTFSESDSKTLTVTYVDANGDKQTVSTQQANNTYTFTMPAGDITINASSKASSCVTPDTLITLAGGTQVRVDELTGDELLLVWNMETGRFDAAPILFIDRDAATVCEVIYLYFSDGTIVKVIYEHGFWDYDLNRYVYLDRDAEDYLGHTFAKQNGDALEKAVLTRVEIKEEFTEAWSPVTAGHLCYFVNGMLSMPGGVGGLFNIFEVDPETMSYDLEALARDIETYGLYTYEELNALCPLPREMFDAAGGAYLKISIGKGNLTEEELIYMITRYTKFFA